ncbi:MAG: ribonuclease H-like domain-containing protein [Chloroflexi bacterium]|nr:ribonuclease H-like domain-containing protein [Chloroflexota bacterium]
MLRNTFIHLPQVGTISEQEIWDSGVTSWEDFLRAPSLPARIQGRDSELRSLIQKSSVRLDEADAWYFNKCLPRGERWRLYGEFRHRAAFLDIETTGLSPAYSYITMVGILDSDGYTAYVRDENLDDLRGALEKYDLVVTFNGAAFDLPYIEHFFGRVFSRMAHIDLRFPLGRLGYRGGLKSIEANLRVGRPSELTALSGFDAVLLWGMWQDGNRDARDTLIRYNAEDVASLPALSEIVYNGLASRLSIRPQPLAPAIRHDITLPYDIDTIRLLAGGRNLHSPNRRRSVLNR